MTIAPEFLIVVLALELTPGPNMTTLALLTLDRGLRAGLATVLGVALGLAAHAVAVGLGAGLAVEQFPWLYEVLRWAGVIYMMWLAVEIWRSPVSGTAQPLAPADGVTGFIGRGFVLNILNPKSILFFLIVVPRFITVPPPPPWVQTLALGAVYVAIATVIHATIVLLAARMGPLLEGRTGPTALKRTLAILLAAVALWLSWETRRPS